MKDEDEQREKRNKGERKSERENSEISLRRGNERRQERPGDKWAGCARLNTQVNPPK